jgi:hypothetical protein
MRCGLRSLAAGLLALLVGATSSWSQTPGSRAVSAQDQPAAAARDGLPCVALSRPMPAAAEPSPVAEQTLTAAQAELQRMTEELRQATVLAKADEKPDETLKKKVDLLQKQIEVQQKMINLLLEQMKKAPAGALEALQTKVATLESRSEQAARRDQALGQAVDNLNEHIDSEERNGPYFPAALKEMFLASRTNETPVSIYGTFVENYRQPNGQNGVFSTPDFAPFFFVQLNEQFLLTASVDITNAGVGVGEAQIDWLVSDWLTAVIGRYLTPIGFFNERLNHEWINRLPDVPLMFRQVSPLSSTDGLMFRGGAYICGSPVKLEYDLYGGNGLQANMAPKTLSATADLENITGGSDETNLHSLGGRVGFWVPAWGLQGGLSGYVNGRYSSAAPDQFNLWQVDLNYRQGDWDVRFEYANNFQQAFSYIGHDIRRQGFYAQVAYRPYELDHCILNKLEGVIRYSKVWFKGIDPMQLDPTAFASPIDVPVNRDQLTIGLNYYFYPSMALRLAYEYNRELKPINLHDSIFLAQYVWAF